MFLPSIALAQIKEKVLYELFCIDVSVLEATLEEFKEFPFVRGNSKREPVGMVPLVLFVNPETKSWTIVEKVEHNTYCVLAMGSGLEAVPSEIRKELNKNRSKKKY